MDEDEMFDELNKQFKEMLDEQTLESLRVVEDRWQRIGKLVSDLDDGGGADWFEGELKDRGVNIRSLLMFGMKLAIQKNKPPMDYTGSFVSGYLLGYLSALEEGGEDVIDEILSSLPEPKRNYKTEMAGFLEMHQMGDQGAIRTLNQVGQFLRREARAVGQSFVDPDDDWAPVMMVVAKRETTMIGMEIPEDPDRREAVFTEVLPRVIHETIEGPQVVGFVVSAWTVTGEHALDMPPRLHPDRSEALFLYLMNTDGDQEFWIAPILRDGEQAPVLGKWKHEDLDDGPMEGRIVTMFERILS